jgi:hypothetical protein
MKNKRIREMLNVQQVQYESKQTLEIMRQNTSYPTTRKFNYITFAAVNIILLLIAVGACFSGDGQQFVIGLFVALILFILNLLAREAINMITDIADSSVTQVQILRKMQKKPERNDL